MTRHVRRQRLDLRSLAESVADDFADRGDAVALHAGATRSRWRAMRRR